ncbi:MAG: ATP-binding protein, partial [Spirochaetaceae bacterium]|nr:ATP-binding protein [Spirochaetaceae bacterium]
LVNLINGKNKSVIFVAHETEEKEDDVTKKRPDVPGSARKDIVKELDFMGYMEMSGSKRTVSFAPSGAYYAKNSMGLDSVIEIPGIQAGNTFIKDVIVAAIRNRREEDREQSGLYDEAVKQIDGLIDAAKDIAALNEAYGKIAALGHIWDSKLYAWSKVRKAAGALNAVWDKAAGRLVAAARPGGSEEPGRRPNAPPPGGAAPENREKAKTAEELTEEYKSAKTELKNIMSATDGAGKALFSGDEHSAAEKILAGLKGSPAENRAKAIARLLEDNKLLLRNRLAAAGRPAGPPPDDPAPLAEQFRTGAAGPDEAAPGVPAMYEAEEPEGHTDDFEDDIPFETGEAKTGPAEAELDIF